MSKRPKLSDPKFQALKKQGRVKTPRKRRSLEDIIATNTSPSNKGVEKIIEKKGSKMGNVVIKKSDPMNPFGVTFGSKGEFNFALDLHKAGLRPEMQVDLGVSEREFLPGVFLKPFKITIDFYLPDLNVYIDFKGAVTDRALWQYRKLMEDWRLSLRPEDRPYLCTVGSIDFQSFTILAKRGRREDLKLFLFDLK